MPTFRARAARALVRAGLGGAFATLGALIEESRALAGVAPDESAGAGTTLAVALAAPILIVLSALREAWPPQRKHHALTLTLGLAFATAAAVANQALYPRLYPSLHLVLVGFALLGCVVAADAVISSLGEGSVVRAGGVAGIAILSIFSLGATPAARALTRSPETTRALHEKSELLRPVVRLAARHQDKKPPPVEITLDPLASAPPVAPPLAARSNVLLITVDALRADHVGAYGYARATTPNIDALAREGVVFTRAYTSAPQTSYALSSMMTGMHFRALQAAPPTWAEQFAHDGYATAAFYPETIFFTDRPRFEDMERRRLGFDVAAVEYETAFDRVARVQSYVRDLPEDRPFFAWAHLFEPHEPYDAHDEHPFGSAELDRYDSEIAYVDRAIGALVAGVRALRPQTIVVVTADHGEAFGEHASRYHGTTLYEEQIRVPLVIHANGVFSPARVERPVQTIDLFPTLSHVVAVPVARALRGRDLFSVDAGVAFASLPELSMLASGTDRFICETAIDTCALYDLAADPAQEKPLVSGPRVESFRASLGAAHLGNAAY